MHEIELLSARKKLNDLIFEYQNKGQSVQDDAIYQDKLHYLEVELQYINNQMQLLKRAQSQGAKVNMQMRNASAAFANNPVNPLANNAARAFVNNNMENSANNATEISGNNMAASGSAQAKAVHIPQNAEMLQSPQNAASAYPKVSYTNSNINASPVKTSGPSDQHSKNIAYEYAYRQTRNSSQRTTNTMQDYEKMFGKNLMGIFASILIFISLIIFATLILPHLTDTLKMLAMYIASFAVLSAGLVLHRKNKGNLFYIAIIGCGAGSLYLSLLLSNLYFKMIGDFALYVLILAWAIFVKFLTKIRNLVFTIIGQAGIFIASVLETTLCVVEADPQKFFVLSIFYLNP